MKKHEKCNYFLSAGMLLNSINIIASRFLPISLPDAVYILLSLIAVGFMIAGIVINPAVRNSKFRQAKLKFFRKVIGKEN